MDMMRSENIYLRVRDLRFGYTRRTIFNGISFDIAQGECIAITGENGSGKTTLLKLLTGYLRPLAGLIDRRARIGYVPQEVTLAEGLTLRENIAFFARAYGNSWSEERLQQQLRALKIDDYANKVVSALSGGTRQKLNFLVAMLHEPELLLLDEPFNALDWQSYLTIHALLEEWRARGRSILIISHLVFDPSWFDRMLLCENGVLRCTGD